MKNKTLITYIIFISCYLYSCNNDGKKENEPQPVEFIVVNKSPLFNEKNVVFTIDSADNTLSIKLTIKGNRKFPFPLHPINRDTLFKTAFNFDFYFNNKIILSDYSKQHNNSWNHDIKGSPANFSFSSDTIDLRQSKVIIFKIPFYAFHNIKKGKQSIELNVSQNVFTDEIISTEKKKSPGLFTWIYY